MSNAKTRIELTLGDPNGPELHLMGQIDEKLVDETLKHWGLRYREPPQAVATLPMPKMPRCDHICECTDHPDKCGECANNRRKSYFTARPSDGESKIDT